VLAKRGKFRYVLPQGSLRPRTAPPVDERPSRPRGVRPFALSEGISCRGRPFLKGVRGLPRRRRKRRLDRSERSPELSWPIQAPPSTKTWSRRGSVRAARSIIPLDL
jgi:hypothetical protein